MINTKVIYDHHLKHHHGNHLVKAEPEDLDDLLLIIAIDDIDIGTLDALIIEHESGIADIHLCELEDLDDLKTRGANLSKKS